MPTSGLCFRNKPPLLFGLNCVQGRQSLLAKTGCSPSVCYSIREPGRTSLDTLPGLPLQGPRRTDGWWCQLEAESTGPHPCPKLKSCQLTP